MPAVLALCTDASTCEISPSVMVVGWIVLDCRGIKYAMDIKEVITFYVTF